MFVVVWVLLFFVLDNVRIPRKNMGYQIVFLYHMSHSSSLSPFSYNIALLSKRVDKKRQKEE